MPKRNSAVADLIAKNRILRSDDDKNALYPDSVSDLTDDDDSGRGVGSRLCKPVDGYTENANDSDEDSCIESYNSAVPTKVDQTKNPVLRILNMPAKKRPKTYKGGGTRQAGRNNLVVQSLLDDRDKILAKQDCAKEMMQQAIEKEEKPVVKVVPVSEQLKTFLGKVFVYEETTEEGTLTSPYMKYVHQLEIPDEVNKKFTEGLADHRHDAHSIVKMTHEDPILLNVVWRKMLYLNHVGHESMWINDDRTDKSTWTHEKLCISCELLSQIYVAANCDYSQQNKFVWARIRSTAAHIATININRFEFAENIVSNTMAVCYLIYLSNKQSRLNHLNLWSHTSAIEESCLDTDTVKRCSQSSQQLKAELAYGLLTPAFVMSKVVCLFVRSVQDLEFSVTSSAMQISETFQRLCVGSSSELHAKSQSRTQDYSENFEALSRHGFQVL
jgi:hypothetical protein